MRIYEAPAVVLPVERKGGSRRLLITTHLKIIFIITLTIMIILVAIFIFVISLVKMMKSTSTVSSRQDVKR